MAKTRTPTDPVERLRQAEERARAAVVEANGATKSLHAASVSIRQLVAQADAIVETKRLEIAQAFVEIDIHGIFENLFEQEGRGIREACEKITEANREVIMEKLRLVESGLAKRLDILAMCFGLSVDETKIRIDRANALFARWVDEQGIRLIDLDRGGSAND